MDMNKLNLKEHGFERGHVLIQIIGKASIQQYYVEDVVSKYKIRVRLYDDTGKLTHSSRTFYGSDLNTLVLNSVATNLIEELSQLPAHKWACL
jgi:hypothetical protein